MQGGPCPPFGRPGRLAQRNGLSVCEAFLKLGRKPLAVQEAGRVLQAVVKLGIPGFAAVSGQATFTLSRAGAAAASDAGLPAAGFDG